MVDKLNYIFVCSYISIYVFAYIYLFIHLQINYLWLNKDLINKITFHFPLPSPTST